jgi:hypothetical protein
MSKSETSLVMSSLSSTFRYWCFVILNWSSHDLEYCPCTVYHRICVGVICKSTISIQHTRSKSISIIT